MVGAIPFGHAAARLKYRNTEIRRCPKLRDTHLGLSSFHLIVNTYTFGRLCPPDEVAILRTL
jgi:hypothetical protein